MSNLASYEEFLQAVANQDAAKTKIALDSLIKEINGKFATQEKIESETLKVEKNLSDKPVTKSEFEKAISRVQESNKLYFYMLLAIILLKGNQSIIEIIKSVL